MLKAGVFEEEIEVQDLHFAPDLGEWLSRLDRNVNSVGLTEKQ